MRAPNPCDPAVIGDPAAFAAAFWQAVGNGTSVEMEIESREAATERDAFGAALEALRRRHGIPADDRGFGETGEAEDNLGGMLVEWRGNALRPAGDPTGLAPILAEIAADRDGPEWADWRRPHGIAADDGPFLAVVDAAAAWARATVYAGFRVGVGTEALRRAIVSATAA